MGTKGTEDVVTLGDEALQALVAARRVLGPFNNTTLPGSGDVYDGLVEIITDQIRRGRDMRIKRGIETMVEDLRRNDDVDQAIRAMRDMLDGEEPF